MSNIDISPEPLFSTKMTKMEITTPVHADEMNTRYKQLLENDMFLYDNKSNTTHKHETSDITDFPTALPADGGDADTLDGKGVTDFVQNYKSSVPENTDILEYAKTIEANNLVVARLYNPTNTPPGYTDGSADFWAEIYVLNKGKYIRVNLKDIRSNNEYANTCLGGTWQGWTATNDGGNANTLGGKTEAQLIKYDDLFAYTDGRIISSVLWINVNEFDDAMRKTYGIIPGTPDSPPGVSYGIRLPCIAYDKNGVLVTVVQLDPYENQGKVWTNVYRKHLGSWTGWRANNDGGNANTVDGLHFGVLTQAAYDALPAKDPNMIYFTV